MLPLISQPMIKAEDFKPAVSNNSGSLKADQPFLFHWLNAEFLFPPLPSAGTQRDSSYKNNRNPSC